MSNIIPILSSSPPPIDDTPSFEDDWDNDDFGGFQGAGPSGGTPAFANNIPGATTPGGQQPHHQQPPQQPSHIKAIDKQGIIKTSTEKDGEEENSWADFSGPAPPPVVDGEFVAFSSNDIQTGPSSSVNNPCPDDDEDLSVETRASCMGLHLQTTTDRTVAHGDGRKSPRSSSSSSGSHEDRRNSSSEDFNTKTHDTTTKVCKPDSQDNTSQDSVTDSGLCSDISPVPKFEEYPDFGDNKSSEVDFSDEGTANNNNINTTNRVSLEQDEGFANFAAVDSWGTGSEKSPDSSSQQAEPFQNHNTHLDPLDLRRPEVEEEEEEEMNNFAQFSCAGCEGSQEWDGEAVTPTQSQYDVENVSTNSPSPNPQSSPEQEKTDDNNVEFPSTPNTLNQNDLTPAESNASSNTLEDIVPEHSKDAAFSDIQSTTLEASSSQEGEASGSNRPTSACDSSGTESSMTGMTEPAAPPSLTDASTSAATQPASLSSRAPSSRERRNSEEGAFAWSEDEDQDEDWEFQDAVATQSGSRSGDQCEKKAASEKSGESGAEEEEDDDDDEFGEFASLSKTAGEKSEVSGDNMKEGCEEEEEDDWAFQAGPGVGGENEDFGNFASTAPGGGGGFAAFTESEGMEEGDDGENWASFSQTAQVPPVIGDDDDDDQFGDFDDITVVSSEEKISVPAYKPVRSVEREPIEKVVGRMFSLSEHAENQPAVELLFVHMTKQTLREEQQVQTKQPGRHTSVKSVSVDMNVWNNLRDLEKTAALRYTWDKSTNNNCLLHSLSIDTRNILIGHKKSSVPIFASNLGVGVLEPCRGPPEVGREGRVSEGAVNALVTTAKLTAGTPQDIPPAEFDWSSAGLTNPLDSSNVQLDLDFFVKKTAWSYPAAYTATSPTAALENELLKAIEPEESKQPKTLEPLENYLANLKVASTAPPTFGKESDADQLTEPAYDMVSKLPDLSFMRAKMLMFPVKGTSD